MALAERVGVIEALGPYVDRENDISEDYIDDVIDKIGRSVQSELGGLFVAFNALTDTPVTPARIEGIVQNLSIARALRKLAAAGNHAAHLDADKFKNEAREELADIKNNPDKAMHFETKTGQALTFGTSDAFDWTVAEDEALIPSPIASGDMPNIIASTVEFTAGTVNGGVFTDAQLLLMRQGVEYKAVPDYGRRSWILKALDSRIHKNVDAGTLEIKMQWNYRRNMDADLNAGEGDGVLLDQWG